MKYNTSEEKPTPRTYKVELLNTETNSIAITQIETETLNITKLKNSLPNNYQLITFWIK